MVMAQSLSTLILLATQWQISREAVLFQLHCEIQGTFSIHTQEKLNFNLTTPSYRNFLWEADILE